MSADSRPQQRIDLVRHMENRRLIPVEDFRIYAGQHVAYSADGTRIIAVGIDYESLASSLRDMGIDGGDVVWSYIPGLNEDTWL